jgi:hypothetical protein
VKGDDQPITLELDRQVAVRARAEGEEPATEAILSRSTASGRPVRVCLNRRYLQRALKLGFTEIQIVGADRPVLCTNDQSVYLWMPLGNDAAVSPASDMRRISSVEGAVAPTCSLEGRQTPMPASHNNGHTTENSRPDASQPERWGIAEVIAETETLRGLLQDASARSARLLAALKYQRRQSRAVQQAMHSLRQLQIDE